MTPMMCKRARVKFYADFLPEVQDFAGLMSLQGRVYRAVKDRQTHQLTLGGQSVFIKKHYGVGWLEIIKNLVSLKRPVLGARNEWLAIQRLQTIGIATTPLLAFGERGCLPASRQSFIITQDLGDIITLEELCAPWIQHPPAVKFKRNLIKKVAQLARTFHADGMVHRDFYLCHFALEKSLLKTVDPPLILMDLHRVEKYSHLPKSKRMKDLAGLYFSAMHIGLTQRDVCRFLSVYFQQSLRQSFQEHHAMLLYLSQRATQLDQKLARKLAQGVKL